MVFDKTDTKLSGFISQASVDDLSAITSLVFSRVAKLERRQQDQFIHDVKRDPEAKSVLEKIQSLSD